MTAFYEHETVVNRNCLLIHHHIGLFDSTCISDKSPSSSYLLSSNKFIDDFMKTMNTRLDEDLPDPPKVDNARLFPKIGPAVPPWVCAPGKRPTYCIYKVDGVLGFFTQPPSNCEDCESLLSCFSQAIPTTENFLFETKKCNYSPLHPLSLTPSRGYLLCLRSIKRMADLSLVLFYSSPRVDSWKALCLALLLCWY